MNRTLLQPDIFPACDQARSILQEAQKKAAQPAQHRMWHFVSGWNKAMRRTASPLLLVARLAQVDNAFVQHIRSVRQRPKAFLLFSTQLPCQAVAERLAKLNVRDPERIHLTRAETTEELSSLLSRLLTTLRADDPSARVLDAWWEADTLVVLSPRFNRLRVPLKKLPSLRAASPEHLKDFEIDEDGAYIYWPALDVHLGWEQFLQAVDEKACLKARQESREFNKRYGSAIKSFRKNQGLRQSDIKGLTARQVGRIERGECRATHAALTKLANAHKMNASDYMAKLAKLLD